MKKITALLFALALFGGCLSSQVLPEEKLPVAPQTTAPPQPLSFVSFELISDINRSLPLTELIPVIESMQAVDFSNPVNVLENDLSVANVPDKNELVSSILESRETIYLEPKKEMSIILFYTIFRLNSTKNAERVAEVYKTNWNTENTTIANKTIWLWRGYLHESAGLLNPFTPNVIIYYDGVSKKAFLSNRRQGIPALAELKEPLYSLHGEAAVGEYFLMMDVKARLPEVENRSMKIFEEILSKITINETAQISQPLPPLPSSENKTADKAQEIKLLETSLQSLLESYLKGNITKEEYTAKQQEYLRRIEELRNQSTSK